MNKFTITFTKQFSEEDISDILCNAFEGGVNYWCVLDNDNDEWDYAEKTVSKVNSDYVVEDVMLELLKPCHCIRLFDVEDCEEKWTLDMSALIKGIVLSIEKGNWSGNIDDLDCEIGDSIIQYALFGEIVYG